MKPVFDVLPVDYKLGRRAPVEREPYPAPAFTSRDPEPAGLVWPSTVGALEGKARGMRWLTVRQVSRGCKPHSTTGRPGAERTYFALRMRTADGARNAYAVHDGRGWDSIAVWCPKGSISGILVGELDQWLAGPEDPVAWIAEIRARHAAKDFDKKRRLACNRGDHDSTEVYGLGVVWCARCKNKWVAGQDPWKKMTTRTTEGL